MTEAEYLTATEASQIMEVSKKKMADLLSSGELPYISDPRNKRAKLIKRTDIDAWLSRAVRPRVPHQRKTIPQVS